MSCGFSLHSWLSSALPSIPFLNKIVTDCANQLPSPSRGPRRSLRVKRQPIASYSRQGRHAKVEERTSSSANSVMARTGDQVQARNRRRIASCTVHPV